MVVTCNGCFDVLHSGHLFFLGYALSRGTSLVVGINSDDYIRRTKRLDFIPQEIRRENLLSLGFIKTVEIFEEDSPIEFIRRIRPNIHCTGVEYSENCAETQVCDELGIELVFIPRVGDWSTTSIREKQNAGNDKGLPET